MTLNHQDVTPQKKGGVNPSHLSPAAAEHSAQFINALTTLIEMFNHAIVSLSRWYHMQG